jgi:hypothetical protein
MFNFFSCKTKSLARPALLALFALALLPLGACDTHKTVEVPPVLPLVDASTDQLISEINRLAVVKSIHGRLDIKFEDTSFATSGVAEEYRAADAVVTLQRPGKVYLEIQFAFVDIARMTSDGTRFRVAILKGDEKYKRFVKGTNNAVYAKLNENGSRTDPKKQKPMGEKETVNALSNLRPQHLTDALMIRAIQPAPDAGFIYSRSEFYQEEADPRPGAKKGARVLHGYYLLEELSQTSPGEAHLNRRMWFDRVGSIRLARLQTFDDRGLLVTDVSYSDEKSFGEGGRITLPSRIVLTRPQDHYKLSLTYQAPESVLLDREYPSEAFLLENKWQLPEVDLDAPKEAPASSPNP